MWQVFQGERSPPPPPPPPVALACAQDKNQVNFLDLNLYYPDISLNLHKIQDSRLNWLLKDGGQSIPGVPETFHLWVSIQVCIVNHLVPRVLYNRLLYTGFSVLKVL